MSSVKDRNTTDEPDNEEGDGTMMRGKACENGCTCVIAYGKFQPSGISDESRESRRSLFCDCARKIFKKAVSVHVVASCFAYWFE